MAIPYFHMANCHTIIGTKRFHFRVRDGIGWFTLVMVTKQTGVVNEKILTVLEICFSSLALKSYVAYNEPKLIGCYRVKPHG